MWLRRRRLFSGASGGTPGTPTALPEFSPVYPGKFLIAGPMFLTTPHLSGDTATALRMAVDGVIIEARKTNTSSGTLLQIAGFDHTTALVDADMDPAEAEIAGVTYPNNIKWLFLRIDARAQANLDWNNSSHVTQIADNWATVGRMCADLEVSTGRSVGLLFDCEPYNRATPTCSVWEYNDLANPSARTYAQSRDDVRAAWDQISTAFWTEHPTGNIILSLGYLYAETNALPKAGGVWEDSEYSLLPDMCDGFCDAIASFPSARISDYTQAAYNGVTFSNFNYYLTNPTFGVPAITRPRSSNASALKYDMAFWPNSAGRNTIAAVTSSNTINYGPGGGHFYLAGNNFWSPQTGNRSVSTSTYTGGAAGTTLTISGAPATLPANSYGSVKSDVDNYNSCNNGRNVADKFCLIYNGGVFSLPATPGRFAYPDEVYDAIEAAYRGEAYP